MCPPFCLRGLPFLPGNIHVYFKFYTQKNIHKFEKWSSEVSPINKTPLKNRKILKKNKNYNLNVVKINEHLSSTARLAYFILMSSASAITLLGSKTAALQETSL